MVKQLNSFLVLLGMTIFAIVDYNAFQNYKGGLLTYSTFSISFLLLLISAFYRNNSDAYLFLVIFLWMGFWAKLSVHLIVGYDYVEPTGSFNWSADAWDQVLWISTVACWGLLLGRLILFRGMGEKPDEYRKLLFYPEWYPRYRISLWIFLVAFVLGANFSNITLGIQQIGLAPRTVLLWPMNALIAWVVSIGGAIAVASLVWWELSFNRQGWISIFAVLIEAFLSTASLLSRGIYIFHSVPSLLALYRNKKYFIGFSRLRFALVAIAFCMLFVVSIVSVTTFRSYLYPHAGGFTTLDQERLTRIEVLNGGINHIRHLILKGEPRENEILDLLKEKYELEIALKRPLSKDSVMMNKLIALDEKIVKEKLLTTQDASYQSQVLLKLLEDKNYLIKQLLMVKPKTESMIDRGVKDIKGIAKIFVFTPEVLADEFKATKSTVFLDEEISKNDKNDLLEELLYQLRTGWVKQVLSLSIDRWIGLEGVMAVVSYEEKSFNFMFDALIEKRYSDTVTKYQEVCQSKYIYTDNNTWQFASLPGSVAFLYFSGSALIVFLGMCLFSVLVQCAEGVIYHLTKNPILCALLGGVFANWVAQFGITPRQDIPYYFMIFLAVLFISSVQKIRCLTSNER